MTDKEKLKLAVGFIRKVKDIGRLDLSEEDSDWIATAYRDLPEEAWHVLADMEEL